eukprot:jgi/Bigna1/74280/fgenesh1_pg.28_\
MYKASDLSTESNARYSTRIQDLAKGEAECTREENNGGGGSGEGKKHHQGIKKDNQAPAEHNTDEKRTGGARKTLDGMVDWIRGVVNDGIDIAYSISRQRGGERFLTEQAALLQVPADEIDIVNDQGLLSPGVWIEISRGVLEGATGRVVEVKRSDSASTTAADGRNGNNNGNNDDGASFKQGPNKNSSTHHSLDHQDSSSINSKGKGGGGTGSMKVAGGEEMERNNDSTTTAGSQKYVNDSSAFLNAGGIDDADAASSGKWRYLVRLTNGRTVLVSRDAISVLLPQPTHISKTSGGVGKRKEDKDEDKENVTTASPAVADTDISTTTTITTPTTSSSLSTMTTSSANITTAKNSAVIEAFPLVRVWEGRAPRIALRSSVGNPIAPTPLPTANLDSKQRKLRRKERRSLVFGAAMATTVSAHKGGAAASKSSIISGGDSSTADTVAAAAAPPPPPFLPESMRLPQVHPPPPPEPSEAPPPPPPESGYMTKFLLWARKGVSKSAHGNKGDEEEEEERRAREMRHKRAVAAAAAFREALDRHENRIRSLQGERAKIRDEMTRDLRRWERYAIEELEVLGQRTMAIRLINIGARLDLESAYLQALVGILNKIQVWIRQGCDENNTPTGVDLEVFLKLLARELCWGYCIANEDGVESGIEVDEIIQFPNLNHNLSECKRLEQESSSLLQKYREMVDQLVVKEAFSARKKRLVRVLQIGDGAAEWDETYGRYWRAESAESRRLFRAIMLDERQSEGQLIRRWRALLHAAVSSSSIWLSSFVSLGEQQGGEGGGGGGGGGSNVSPDAVRAFFLHILRQTAGRYALTTERQIGALDLLMARLVYPLISFVVCNLHTPHEYQMDLKFLDNSRLLRCVAASKLGVLPCHLPRRNGEGGGGGGGGGEKEGKGRYQETTSYHQQKQEEQPYHDACHALSEMGRTVVPADMLQAGLQAIRLIRETSSRYFMGHLNGGEAGEGGGKGGVKSGDSTDAADDDERERSAMMKQKYASFLPEAVLI